MVSSLGQIGLAALVITVLAMAGSLLCLTLLRRFVLKLDHYGLPRGSEAAREEEAHHSGKADNSLTFLIVIAVVLGMLAVSYTHLDVYKRQTWARTTRSTAPS